jgi:hypothetical protein
VAGRRRRDRIVHAAEALVTLHWAGLGLRTIAVQVQTALRIHGDCVGSIDTVIGPLSRRALLRLRQDCR